MPPEARLSSLLAGYAQTQLIAVAAKLGLADLLHENSLTIEELNTRTGTHPAAFRRFVRGLIVFNILVQDENGRLSLTPMGEFLRSDHPQSFHSYAILCGEENYRAWGKLYDTVMSGETGFKLAHGLEFFPYLEANPAVAERFDRTMVANSGEEVSKLAEVYDFSAARLVIDVGGGNGAIMAALLKMFPDMKGIVFDRPQTVEGTGPVLAEAGVFERCRVIGGDFFQAVPAGGDLYILSNIIHDWPDQEARQILQNCRRAIEPDGRLVLLEKVLPEQVQARSDWRGVWLDLNMLVNTGGVERTEKEYAALLADCGFKLSRVIPTNLRHEIIEAQVSRDFLTSN